MKNIVNFFSDFIWFFKESKPFTNYSYKRIILKEKGILRALYFCKKQYEWRKYSKKHGTLAAYCALDHSIEL